MSLDESIEIALRSNPAISIARENMQKATADVQSAVSAERPKLVLDGSYQRFDRPQAVYYGDSAIDLSSLYNRSASFSLVQPLDIYGVYRVDERTASIGKVSSRYDYEKQVNDTILDVTIAFYNVHRTAAYQRVTEETVSQLEAHVKDSEANLKAGTIANFDVLRAQTELANARQKSIEARNGVELAKCAFNNALDLPLDNPVDLATPAQLQVSEPDLKACIDSACEYRQEVRQADNQVSYSQNVLKAARLRSKPRVDLRMGYFYGFDADAFIPKGGSWRAFLATSVPLFDGGYTKAGIDRAESNLRNAKTAREQAIRDVKLDTQQAYQNMVDSRARMKAAGSLLDESREGKRLASLSYRAGILSPLEVLDAQTGLTGAETNSVNAEYDYREAVARLERAVGGRAQMARLIGTQSKSK